MASQNILQIVASALDDKKAEEIVILNMVGLSSMADQFVICHGNSDKQVQAIAKNVKDEVTKNDYEIKRMEGYDEARWVLIDCGDIIVHVFHKDERSYYNLEKLWGDAPTMELNKILA
ncbi:ribosome silencing factor [Lottiidibacillus patelloidae]|uniref:Ribosomal silencing factor RsfS n=1 Tax=Lottiidibacillus patelloidae TaxID=2670334 RepID=A0A263BVM0_9BACI|nr:ribosome silencing factor [Lottiidibacillus patelloidae]OZM57769.1 ribosome silencing factor [Lottiidibacillus patelloidae]